MSGWRTALRIARREMRRAKGRAALVTAMIALPVAALSFAAVTYDTFDLRPEERAERLMGTTQAVVSWPYASPVAQEPDQPFALPIGEAKAGAEPTEQQLLELLPPGTQLLPNDISSLNIHTTAGTGGVRARLIDYEDPMARGMLRQLSGRAPRQPDEVAITPKAAERTGAGIGGTIRTTDGRTFQVVGIVEEPDGLDNTTLVLRPGAIEVSRADRAWLAALPEALTWANVKELNRHGVAAVSRHVLHNPPPAAERYRQINGGGEDVQAGVLALIAGLAILEIVLLAGPALAVGARRRRRDLALVAATGGTPAHVRRIVLADGLVLGVVAAVSGVAVGACLAVAGHSVVERFTEIRSGALRMYPSALGVLAVLAVVTGVLAALVPAWISSRQDVVTALAGRRGITRSRRRWLVIGLALIAIGAATALIGAWKIEMTIILAGLVVGELGLVLITPSLVGLVARLGRVLPVPLRIALRDTSRNRTAAAPAISAVMAVVIASLAVGVVLNSQMARDASEFAGNEGDVSVYQIAEANGRGQPIPASVGTAIRETMPAKELHEVKLLSCDGGPCFAHARPPKAVECPYSPDVLHRAPTEDEQRAARADSRCDDHGKMYRYFGTFATPFGLTVVIAPEAAGAVAGISAEDGAKVAAAMRAGEVIVHDQKYLENDKMTLSIGLFGKSAEPRLISAPGYAMPNPPKAPIVLMTEDTARSLGFGATPFTLHTTTTRMPTVEEQDALAGRLGVDYDVRVQRLVETDIQRSLTILAIVAGVITLGAAALATGLAAADGRGDLTTLAAVGASPTLRRVLSLSQSGVIAGLGSVLGTAAGLGTSIAVLTALNQRYADQWPVQTLYPITVPWLNVAIALLVVPLVAMLGAGLLTRSRLPIERRE